MTTAAVTDRLVHHQAAAVERLVELLAIPSVSTDPARRADVRDAAAWVDRYCQELGLSAEVMQTPGDGHPAVVVDTPASLIDPGLGARTPPAEAGGPRTVLFYGHYDVQPPDPEGKWSSPPFDPQVRDAAVYARGASDDKGQVMCFLEAVRAWLASHGKLPCRVKMLIEGEEEVGSIHLPPFLGAHADRLAADVCVVSDTSMWQVGDAPRNRPRPAITYALRGLVYFDVKLHGPSRDLHSGVFGGTLANPATMLARVLGGLFDDQHRIAIPGFYDRVAPLADAERRQWDGLGFDDTQWLGAVGAQPFGEAGCRTLERRWARPSCDINGLYGGFQGEGAKTVIPTFAGAKVSFRIPADMDPRDVAERFEAWIRGHEVGGCRWEITNHGEAHPVATPLDSPYMAAASAAVEKASGHKPVLVREGATIPVVADFKRVLGLDTLLIGFGLDSDNIHSPDEHFALDRYLLGQKTHAELLAALA